MLVGEHLTLGGNETNIEKWNVSRKSSPTKTNACTCIISVMMVGK